MKRKVLVTTVAVVAIAIITIALAVLVFNKPQSVPVPYDGTLKHTHGYDGAFLSLFLHSSRTLFNCEVTISYTAINGTAV